MKHFHLSNGMNLILSVEKSLLTKFSLRTYKKNFERQGIYKRASENQLPGSNFSAQNDVRVGLQWDDF